MKPIQVLMQLILLFSFFSQLSAADDPQLNKWGVKKATPDLKTYGERLCLVLNAGDARDSAECVEGWKRTKDHSVSKNFTAKIICEKYGHNNNEQGRLNCFTEAARNNPVGAAALRKCTTNKL